MIESDTYYRHKVFSNGYVTETESDDLTINSLTQLPADRIVTQPEHYRNQLMNINPLTCITFSLQQ